MENLALQLLVYGNLLPSGIYFSSSFFPAITFLSEAYQAASPQYSPTPRGKKDLMRIQERCQPYLIPTRPSTSGNGYTLLRASWYPLSIGREERKFLYLAHHEKEYKQMVGNQLCRPLVNVRCLPEAPIPEREEMKVMKQLTHIWTAGSTPSLFKRPVFIRWMKGRVKTYLKRVRQLYYLFEHFPIMEVIYGSTLNANGVLVTSVAQKMGAFTVNMQHGVFGEVGHLPVNADLQLVWGDPIRNFSLLTVFLRRKSSVSHLCLCRASLLNKAPQNEKELQRNFIF